MEAKKKKPSSSNNDEQRAILEREPDFIQLSLDRQIEKAREISEKKAKEHPKKAHSVNKEIR